MTQGWQRFGGREQCGVAEGQLLEVPGPGNLCAGSPGELCTDREHLLSLLQPQAL